MSDVVGDLSNGRYPILTPTNAFNDNFLTSTNNLIRQPPIRAVNNDVRNDVPAFTSYCPVIFSPGP